MERRKTVSAHILSTKSARNPREVKMIEAYNTALIGSARTINHYGMSLDDFIVEEAGAEAGLAVLLNADFDRPCKTYAWRCGQSYAIKASKREIRERSFITGIDEISERGSDYDGDGLIYEKDNYLAVQNINEKEEQDEHDARMATLWKTFERLTELDKKMYLMLIDNKSYKDIAPVLGCSENSLYKRRIDGAKRFRKLLKNQTA